MKILKDVLSLSTAPFHEEEVMGYISRFCSKYGFKLKRDRHNNLLVRHKRGGARQAVIFSAHMDHPGFEVIGFNGKKPVVGILGGVNLDHFKGANVAIKTARGIVKGVVANKTLKRKWRGKKTFEIGITKCHSRSSKRESCEIPAYCRGDDTIRKGDYGWYDLPGFKLKNGLVHTKGADNLASTAALLELLLLLKKRRVASDVTCVFTRAEEVGFIGCMALARQKQISPNVPLIVLECSSAKAGGVKIGDGPVVRVGDRMSCYDPVVESWLKNSAMKLKCQRALLSGGTCEASVWTFLGQPNGGLAFPLGNYHNIGDNGYAPEFISVSDYKNMQRLLISLARSKNYLKPFEHSRKLLAKNFQKWRDKL